jgi:putative restriction endonuclease
MDFKKIVKDLGLEVEHQIDLRWFLSHRGVVQGFPERLESSDHLANSYQGIYKPHGYKYALSIRVSLDSPFRHGHFFPLGNDGWVFAYHPETSEKDLQNSDQSWTILRISECQDNQVPLGILRQTGTSNKGKSQYEIMGLGIVVGKFGEYFVLADLTSSKSMPGDEIVRELFLAEAESLLIRENSQFEANEATQDAHLVDEYHDKVRVLAEITRRRGQGVFRKKLLEAYRGRCCISGCLDQPVLDAAHIIPYSQTVSNEVSNGLILRTDLHTLFDEDLLGIDPSTMTVYLSDLITDPEYLRLVGTKVQIPQESRLQPSNESLTQRWFEFKSRSQKS